MLIGSINVLCSHSLLKGSEMVVSKTKKDVAGFEKQNLLREGEG